MNHPMNHFIYSMNASDPAPASGGDTKSWFFYYKWDVDDFAYVPVDEEDFHGYELQGNGKDLLWFVMDKMVLGVVCISSVMPSLDGKVELHYDTRKLLGCIETSAGMLPVDEKTGRPSDPATFNKLYEYFGAVVPTRQTLREKAGAT